MRNLSHSAFAAALVLAAIGLAGPAQAQATGGDQGQNQVQGQTPKQDQGQAPKQDQGQDQTQNQNQNQDQSPGYHHGYGMMGRGYGPGTMDGYGRGSMMRPGYGPGMSDRPDCVTGRGYGPGYGMMDGNGPGYGPGMMGGNGQRYRRGEGNYRRQVTVDNLSADNVKSYFERIIAEQGNSRLKVGEVKEKDADTIVADIVTKDNSLVQRFAVNRHTGFYRPSED